MDTIQEEFERSVGDRFIEWLNTETGSQYSFADRPDRAPDLLYSEREPLENIQVALIPVKP